MKFEFPEIDQSLFESLLVKAKTAKEKGGDIYNDSYPYFTQYFNKADQIGIDHFYIGVYFTYGWMPTIPEIKIGNIDRLITSLNRVKKGDYLTENDLEFLKGVVNNSIVGASKLLHFIRPDTYPIWDSNIAGYFSKSRKPHAYEVNNVQAYIGYIKFVHMLISDQKFKPFFDIVSENFTYPITLVRSLEYILFSTTRNQKIINRNLKIVNT
jgi:hypothetical protein